MKDFIKGMDLSTLLELQECGARYYDGGKEENVLSILKKYGMNAVRLRLWADPYAADGTAYGAGTNDLPRTLRMARMAVNEGLDFLLDIHYSDFWTDPGKQIKPKAWASYSVAELEQAMYDYTRETMIKLKEESVFPTMVQIGNELSNGMLWPEGKVPAYAQLARFINAGIRGVRAVDRELPVMIHLDNGGNHALYREWFDQFMKYGEEFQVIGLSYYPFWHGSLTDLSNNMNDIALRYGKELIVAEVSMGYTMEDYRGREKQDISNLKGMATRPELVAKLDYPMTVQGQSRFMQDFMTRIREVPEGRGRGFYYWEPAWIPVPGSGWATPASLAYMKDPGPCGNEWANQALFDYDGNALPTLQVIADF